MTHLLLSALHETFPREGWETELRIKMYVRSIERWTSRNIRNEMDFDLHVFKGLWYSFPILLGGDFLYVFRSTSGTEVKTYSPILSTAIGPVHQDGPFALETKWNKDVRVGPRE